MQASIEWGKNSYHYGAHSKISFDSNFFQNILKGLFHPACLACVVSWFAFVVAIFLGHEKLFLV